MTPQAIGTERLLRIKQVMQVVPLGRSTIWLKVKQGKFPQPVKLSERCTAWKESEIMSWMDSLSGGEAN